MRLVMDDGRDGIEEGQRLLAGEFAHGFGQGGRGQRTGGDDHAGPIGGRKPRDLLAADLDIGMGLERGGHGIGKGVAVDGQRAAGGQAGGIGALQDQRAGAAHLFMEEADGVVLEIVGAQGIGAHQFGQPLGLMGVGAAHRAHLVQHHGNAGLRRRPGGFRPRQPAADDVDGVWHFSQVFDRVRRTPEDCFRVLGLFRLPPSPEKFYEQLSFAGQRGFGPHFYTPRVPVQSHRLRGRNDMGTEGAGFKSTARENPAHGVIRPDGPVWVPALSERTTMNVTDAVLSRRSVRAFRDTPVPQETLRQVLETAARAPSNSNMQPWLVRVVTGETLERLKTAMRARATVPPQFDEPRDFPSYPEDLGEPYLTRRAMCAERQYGAVGLSREDREGRLRYVYRNMQCFGAPAAMFTFIETGMGPSQWADLGIFLQTVMLLLREAGLDSCAQISWGNFAKTVRAVLEVPGDWMLYCGLSIGYGDTQAPVNAIVADRAPLDEFAKFLS